MIRSNATWRLVAVAGAAGLVLAACGGDDDGGSSSSSAAPESSGTPLYLVDGNIGNGPLAELPAGTLAGVKGTLPGAEASSDFKDRLNQIDPSLKKIGYSYGPESYDAAMVVILSAIAAKSDAGRDIAAAMQDTTTGGAKCSSFDECNKMLQQGDDIDYDGQSGPIEFDDFGDPTSAFVGIYQYDDQNLVPGLTTDGSALNYESGQIEPTKGTPDPLTSKDNRGASDDQLKLGGYLPLTGSLASLGPPEVAGVELAVQEANEGGGVLGKDVLWFNGDSSDSANFDKGVQTIDKQIQRGVDAIIGAASSSVSLNTLEQVTGAGILQVSPANTSPDLTNSQDSGLYFRTAPSDVLQGRVLGNLLNADGIQNVAILSLQDAYGEGLAEYTALSFSDGGGTVLTEPDAIYYDPTANNFAAEVSKIKALDPDAIVLIGFDESAKVVSELVKQGIGPNS
jgi:ABC-type branched-subunit amino acid transport system substrate-binding protein